MRLPSIEGREVKAGNGGNITWLGNEMPDFRFSRRDQGRMEQPAAVEFDPSFEGGPETGEESRTFQGVTGLKLLNLAGGEEATGNGDHVAVGIDPFTVDTHWVTQAHGNQG